MKSSLQHYYERNPQMVSSPFGGVDGINQPLFEDVFSRLDINLQGRRVLDVGCGRGYLGDWVRGQGGTYTGADFVVSRSGFPLVQADSAHLPFADAQFDVVCCIDAFEHFPDALAAAGELRRMLGPNGTLFLSVPNYGNVAGLVKWWCEHFGRYEPKTWAPFGDWLPQELEHPLTCGAVRRLFGKAGFTQFDRIGYGAEVGLGLCPWIAHHRMPEAIKFRLQRLFLKMGPAVARICPTATLHNFWRISG